MPFMLLINEPVGQRAERDPPQGEELYARMLRFTEDLKARGQLVASESLKSQCDAVRVEIRGGQRRIVDGPFAESKEMVGGFFLLNVATRDEAIAIAERCPAAQWATVEVREVGPCFN